MKALQKHGCLHSQKTIECNQQIIKSYLKLHNQRRMNDAAHEKIFRNW